MKTKFLSAILLGGFLAASTGTFVSCKDYDDDITDLQSQIDALSKSSTEALSSKASELSSQISTLTSAQSQLSSSLEAAKSDADTKVAAAKAAADAAQAAANGAQGSADAAQGSADAAQSAADAAQATADKALADAQDALARVAVLEAQLEQVNKAIEALQAKDAELEAQIAEAKKAVEENASDASDKIAAVNTALDAAKAELQGQLEVLKSTIETEVANLNKQIAASNALIDQNAQKLTALSESLSSLSEKLTTEIAGLKAAYEAADKAIKEDVTKNSQDIATLQSDLAKLQAALELQEKALTLYEEKVNAELGTLSTDISGNAADIAQLKTDLATLSATVGAQEAAWQDYVQKALAASGVATDATISDLAKRIQALEDALAGYLTTDEYEAYKSNVDKRLEEIEAAANDVNTSINTLSGIFSGRLTSLLFAPSYYINGIEAINFSALHYQAWIKDADKNFLDRDEITAIKAAAGVAANAKNTIINNDDTQAVYYYSPSNAKIEEGDLSLIFNDATNLVTRASVDPVSIAKWEAKNGKLTLNLKKNTTDVISSTNASSSINEEKFTIMALQAKVKSTDETEEVKVSSDWARLNETSIQPYIRNANAKSCNDFNAHFYTYAWIHSWYGTPVDTKSDCSTWAEYLSASEYLQYDKAYDLHDFVTVCDADGLTYSNYTSYGLSFEFNLVPYKVKYNSEESTDQALFASISEDGIITSHAYDNEEAVNNADAVGREPMIQIVLKHGDDIVDIRYMKIKWVAEVKTTSVEFAAFDGKFACNTNIEGVVGTAEMNQLIYTPLNISKTQFHNNYYLDGNLYETYADAENGENGYYNDKLGSISQTTTWDGSTTYNLKWTYNPSKYVVTYYNADGSVNYSINGYTEEEYTAGAATRTVYGRYVLSGSDGASSVVFKLTLNLTIDQMAVTGYRGTQWDTTTNLTASNADKALLVNPSLTSDATYGNSSFTDTQLITDILFGYYSSELKGSPTAAEEAVKGASTAQFVFDADRVTKLLGDEWSVNGKGELVRTVNKVTEIGAQINGNVISLYEVNPGNSGEPTAAAQALISKKVPVKLQAKNCAGVTRDVDHFLVEFVDPLKLNVSDSALKVYDWTTDASYASISGVYTVTERFKGQNDYRKVVWYDSKKGLQQDDDLVAWYIVKGLTWDFDNAKINLVDQNGSLVVSTETDINKWADWADVSDYKLYLATATTNADNSVTIADATDDPDSANAIAFENKSGNSVRNAFKVAIPVKLSTKWNNSIVSHVYVTVEPGTQAAK